MSRCRRKRQTQDSAACPCQSQCRARRPEKAYFVVESNLTQTVGGGVRKRIALAFFTQRFEKQKQVQRPQSGSCSCSHGPQNGFVAAGGHVNLLDTGTCTAGSPPCHQQLMLWQALRSIRWRFSEATRESARLTQLRPVTDSVSPLNELDSVLRTLSGTLLQVFKTTARRETSAIGRSVTNPRHNG